MITIGCLWAAIYTADELLDDVLLTTSAEIMIAVSFLQLIKSFIRGRGPVRSYIDDPF